jgi:putative flippase GtrA
LHILKFLRFSCVGVLTAVIYFLGMWITQSLYALNYISSVSIAYFFSTIFHYFANRLYTFRATKDDYVAQFKRYLILWFLNYIITVLVVWISVDKLLLSPYLGICISVIFTSFIGYVLGHFWVFKLRR